MHKNTPHEPDYGAIANEFFGKATPANILRNYINMFEYLLSENRDYRKLEAERRKNIAAISASANKLGQKFRKLHLDDKMEIAMHLQKLNVLKPREITLEKLRKGLLDEKEEAAITLQNGIDFISGYYEKILKEESVYPVGRPSHQFNDFFMDVLESVWQKNTDRPINRSTKIGEFGRFAQMLLTVPPISFSEQSVRYTLNKMLENRSKHNARSRK